VEDPKIIAERILANVEKVIIGKSSEVRLAVICLLCQGHLLIEDVPGVGKTTLARSLAKSTGCSYKRIQFTPDILPSDVTGVSVYNQRSGDFEFRAGPISAQIVLADEINRATPKTQSALLEAMEERQVTVDGVTRPLPAPFMVMATQNPIEYEALPAARSPTTASDASPPRLSEQHGRSADDGRAASSAPDRQPGAGYGRQRNHSAPTGDQGDLRRSADQGIYRQAG
jgi:hypothetical protein